MSWAFSDSVLCWENDKALRAKERHPTSSDGFTAWHCYYAEPAHKGETPNNTLIWKKFGAGLSIAKSCSQNSSLLLGSDRLPGQTVQYRLHHITKPGFRARQKDDVGKSYGRKQLQASEIFQVLVWKEINSSSYIISKSSTSSVLVRSTHKTNILWWGRLKKETRNGKSVLTFYWVNDFKGNNNSVKTTTISFHSHTLQTHINLLIFLFAFLIFILKPYVSYKMPISKSFLKLLSN